MIFLRVAIVEIERCEMTYCSSVIGVTSKMLGLLGQVKVGLKEMLLMKIGGGSTPSGNCWSV